MDVKHQRARKRICLSIKEKKNYESNFGNKTNPNQANDKYLLPNWEAMGRKLQATSKIV